MHFRDENNQARVFSFLRQPPGLILAKNQKSIRVESFEFNSYAKDIGVCVGWRLEQIGKFEVSHDEPLDVVRHELHEQTHDLNLWPLRMDFRIGNGIVNVFYMTKQPLGIEFTSAVPFKVSHFKPDSYAESRGVQVNWEVLRIGNGLVSCDTGLEVLMRYLSDGLSHLPQESKGFRVAFIDTIGNPRIFWFQRWPLGINFSNQAVRPFSVQSFGFNSYAKDRGVQVGWKIVGIGFVDVSRCESLGQLERSLSEHGSKLALWPLRVDFDIGGGMPKAFYFDRKSLGIEFTRSPPFRIERFDSYSHARNCGLEVGWVLLRIGDLVVSRGISFDMLMECMDGGLQHLP